MKAKLSQLLENTIHVTDPNKLMDLGRHHLSFLTDGMESVTIYIYSFTKKRFFTTLNYEDEFYIPIGVGTVSLCFISRDILIRDSSIFIPMNNDLGVIQYRYSRKFYRGEKDLLIEGTRVFSTILQNALNYKEIRDLFDSFIDVLGASLDARDYVTSGHSKRTALYALIIGNKLKLGRTGMKRLEYSALLHDIGKITIPESILYKGGELTEDEYSKIKTHPIVGKDLMYRIKFPREYRNIPNIIESHHERWDGYGYPNGLEGISIPLEARIIAICDVFDALTSARQYRQPLPFTDAIDMMTTDEGQFDPKLLALFIDTPIEDLLNIYRSYRI